MAKNKRRYAAQWHVPSESDPDKYYTVSLTLEGDMVCHCWPWLRERTTCKHIEAVKAGYIPEVGARQKPEPELVYARVSEVKRVPGSNRLLVPLVPFGEPDKLMTILHDLLQAGVPWNTLRTGYYVPKEIQPADVKRYIETYGRSIIQVETDSGSP